MRDKVEEAFVDLGEQALKNIARPVRIYAIKPGFGSARSTPASSRSAREKSVPPRLSIVVLPFAGMGGDRDQEVFRRRRYRDPDDRPLAHERLLVIGRNTAFTYKGRAADIKQIGRDLNVRYVLEGSVQRSGNRMRVNVQLIDAESDNHVWAERFDKPIADLFDMQDEIVARLARQLDSALIVAESLSGKITNC